MRRQLSVFSGATALAALLSLTAAAQECANGGPLPAAPECANGGPPPIVYGPEYSNGGRCAKGRGPAILTPVEAFGVHPPGPDPADLNRCFFHRWAETFIPYYAPLSPVATSVRWKPWCYFPLMPYYTPYYMGYCPHRLCKPEPPPYGFDGGWGPGPMPPPHTKIPAPPLGYGAYTSILRDDTIFWNMGGNGLVPYGAPRPMHLGPPDLVDMIQVTRQQGGGCGGAGGPAMLAAGAGGPAVLPPTEKAEEKEKAGGYQQGEDTTPAAPPAAKPPADKEPMLPE